LPFKILYEKQHRPLKLQIETITEKNQGKKATSKLQRRLDVLQRLNGSTSGPQIIIIYYYFIIHEVQKKRKRKETTMEHKSNAN